MGGRTQSGPLSKNESRQLETISRTISAHDLRRSFGTSWAGRLKPATLQLLMRHESIETTMKNYVDQDADDIADTLWKDYRLNDR